jgi:hypothetical protein
VTRDRDYDERCRAFREMVYDTDPGARYRNTDSLMRYPGPGNRAERRAMAAQARKKQR